MSFWLESDYYCKPLKSLIEIQSFIQEPPIWRTLCQPLIPHSSYAIKNSEVDSNFEHMSLERPLVFCHFEDHSPNKNTFILHEKKELPKLLVCHDMANGYHDDSINGTDNFAAYTFYNWAAVDIFCYFSHHLVTVPPLAWINAAHAHGVKVIGTFITEWSDGVSIWNYIFSTESELDNLVSSLVAIAKTLKFEGWLINVENKISEPDKLLKFMNNLHKTLHQEIPGAELIWYDSVTKTGQLSWQNGLNELNRPFFDACDGIFTNYSWNENHIEESAIEAGGRIKDVYIGIDVWGRNFYGGGMFNTQEAVKMAYKHGCSLAVFAPAWTHEAMSDGNSSSDPNAVFMGESLTKLERFMIRDRALWDSLWPFFNTKLPCTLPFQTSFCRGLGSKRRRYGEVYTNNPWYNLRHMQYQPNCAHGPHGYLLSTDENIRSISHVAMTRKGILKLRRSLLQLTETEKELAENKIMSDEPKVEDDDKGNLIVDNTIGGKRQKLNTEDAMIPNESKSSEDNKNNEENKISNERKETNNEDKKEKANVDAEEREIIGKFLSHKSSTTNLEETGIDKFKSAVKKIFSFKKKPATEDSEDNNRSLSKRELPELSQRDSKALLEQGSPARMLSSGPSMTLGVTVQLGHSKTRYSVAHVDGEKECLQPWLADSFNGGTCLSINPSDAIPEDHRTIRLFLCDFRVNIGDMLVVCVVTKILPTFPSQSLNVWLKVMSKSGAEFLELMGLPKSEDCRESKSTVYYPLEVTSKEFIELRTHLVMNEPEFYLVPENPFGWNILYFQIPCLKDARVTSINLRTDKSEGSILLGHVGLCLR